MTEDFKVKVTRQPNSPKIKRFEVFYDDVFHETTTSDDILISAKSMADGYHEVRIVGVSDSPAAKRKTKTIGFINQREGHTVRIEIENPRCSVQGTLRVKAVSSEGQDIQILQSSRRVATVKSGESFLIPASRLGLGRTKLQAAAKFSKGQTVKSSPVSVLLDPPSRERQKRLVKVPSNKELKQTIGSIRELLKDQYADDSPAGRKKLLSVLQQTANKSIDAPDYRYALLSECVAAAVASGAVDEGWTAGDQIQAAYEVKELPQIKFLKNIKTTLNQQSASKLYLRGSKKIYQLINDDRFNDAEELTKALDSSVRGLVPTAKADLKQLVAKTKLLKREFKKITDDLEVLANDPFNKKANTAVGTFYCQQKLDFQRGLPYLAKSSDSRIQELARLEMALTNPSSNQRLAVADRWWNLGTDKKLDSFQILAAHQYQQIIDNLEGQQKITAQKRIRETLPLSDIKIAQLLSDDVWQVKWNTGAIWPKMWMENNRVLLDVGSGPVSYDFREIDGVAEMSNVERGVFYKILHLDGIHLEVIGLIKTGAERIKGVASKVAK